MWILPQNGDLERSSLWRGTSVELRHVDLCKQIGEARKGKARFRFARTRHEHAVPAISGDVDAGLPEGCLPDTRGACENEPQSLSGGVVEERLERAQFAVAADYLSDGCPALQTSLPA